MKYYLNELNYTGIFSTWCAMKKYDDIGFPYSGINIFTGPQGAGKTYSAVNTVHHIKKEYPDCIVVSNIKLYDIDFIPYEGIDQLQELDNGINGIVYLIDEIQTLFSSLESSSMPVSTLTVWSQNRKNRRVILGTSQRFGRLAKGLREQTMLHIECKAGLGFLRMQRVLDAFEYDENGKLPPDYKYPWWRFYVPKVSILNSYNTYEVVTRKC